MRKNESNELQDNDLMVERVKENEKFFCSFMDLIPSRVYFNPDDRYNWIQLISNESNKKKKLKSKQDSDEQTNDTSQELTSNGENENQSNGSNGEIIRASRFDPKFFKTVSQIIQDLENLQNKNQKKTNLNLKPASLFLNNKKSIQETKNNTSIKVFNKSQNKSAKNHSLDSSAKSNNENGRIAQVSNGSESNKANNEIDSKDSSNEKKALKRSSKFKEEKREAIKRQRQRYDSQTEPQIVQIDHTDANDKAKDRKPILNKNGQVVFSKFDFTADKTIKNKKSSDNHNKLTPVNAKPKDYKKLLKKLQEEKEKKEQLKETEPEKAIELDTKSKWKSAIDKASGIKVKDDVELLKKAVKRLEKKKDKSRKGWEERTKAVETKKKQLEDKRRKNIEKRKEKKKRKQNEKA